MTVDDLIEKAAKKAGKLLHLTQVSFEKRYDFDERPSEAMEMTFFYRNRDVRPDNFAITVYSFHEGYSVELLLIKLDEHLKTMKLKKKSTDLTISTQDPQPVTHIKL